MKRSLLLLDQYNEKSQLLLHSFRAAGYQGKVLVLRDTGFLPTDVQGLYRYFLEMSNREQNETDKWKPHPRYFNQIQRPDYWEITGNNREGEVKDMIYRRGRIQYTKDYPKAHRIVSQVDWYNRKSICRSSDHYDIYGRLYARTIYDKEGKGIQKTYFNQAKQEVLVENFITGDIIWNHGGQIQIFQSREQMAMEVLHAMEREQGEKFENIYYNSLGVPFLMLYHNQGQYRSQLFWQEGDRQEIPGNMQLLLRRDTGTDKIWIQDQRAAVHFKEMAKSIEGADASRIHSKGYCYPYTRENGGGQQVLICTNSDQIEGLDTVVQGLAEMEIHIAALTEMSPKLMAYGSYHNVRLYPNANDGTFEKLFLSCDYYLDINHMDEIVNAVKRAYLANQLVVGLEQTLHNGSYIAVEHRFQQSEELVKFVQECRHHSDVMAKHLDLQRRYAMDEDVEAYKEFCNE